MRSDSFKRNNLPSFSRRGGAMLEFFGCAVALSGGLLLGSMYLGVDVKDAAMKALQHADVIATPAEPAVDPAALSVDLSDAGGADKAGLTLPSATSLSHSIAIPAEQRRGLTLAYWGAVDESMKNELAGRTAADAKASNLEVFDYLTLRNQTPKKPLKPVVATPLKSRRSKNWALYEYLTIRSKGHKAAAHEIEKLDVRGVDGHITSYAEKALDWHRDGADLYSHALDLLTDAPSAQLSGPFAQAWQSKATQHQMEERLLADKHQAVQSYLDHGNHSGSEGAATDK